MFFNSEPYKNLTDEKKLRYDAISIQIAREDDLAGKRLTWIITINGFLFASLGYLAKGENLDPNFVWLYNLLIPIIGALISFSGLCGVLAAYQQIDYLTKQWDLLNDERWPRPFGDKKNSFFFGVIPSALPPFILTIMWVCTFFLL